MSEATTEKMSKEYERIDTSEDDIGGHVTSSEIATNSDQLDNTRFVIVKNPSIEDSFSVPKLDSTDERNRDENEGNNLVAGTTTGAAAEADRIGDLRKEDNDNLSNGKPSSIARLVRTWENYMTNPDGQNVDQFEPLNMFQQISLCGAGDGILRLGPPPHNPNDGDWFDPISFRHTRSSPIHCTPSMLDNDEMDLPPIGLDRIHRSRSTPLTTSANSAFGTISKTTPYIGGSHGRSAFTLTSQRSSQSASDSRFGPRFSTFDPIAYDSEMDGVERTSIEVTKLSPPPAKPSQDHEEGKNETTGTNDTTMSAAARAAKFLSDVRALHRRRKTRCGRENPAKPASTPGEVAQRVDTTEQDLGTPKQPSNDVDESAPRENGPNVANIVSNPSNKTGTLIEEEGEEVVESVSAGMSYQKLGSDDECDRFQTINGHIDDAGSPSTIPSPIYQHVTDERFGSMDDSRGVQIQVSNITKNPVDEIDTGLPNYSSPIPTQMSRDGSSLTPHSHDSPGTLRSSGTTNTSGHTTQATNTTVSSGQLSHLSSISETDREVMEANKVGSLLRHDRASPVVAKNEFEYLGGNSSAIGYALGYFSLRNSPVNLREGANVEADRFFTGTESKGGSSRRGKVRGSSSSKKGTSSSPSTNTVSSSNASYSSNSTGDEPPVFVSYLERQSSSDLTAFPANTRQISSICEGRGDLEERESPSEILGYSDLIFEEAKAPRDMASKQPRAIWPSNGQMFQRRVRSLPPRSPVKGGKASTTPPPRGFGGDSTSPAYFSLSPPRAIVDHRIEPIVSRPYVLRTTPGSSRIRSQKLVVVSPEGQCPSNSVSYAPISGDGASFGAQEVVREPSSNLRTGLTSGPLNSNGGFRSRTYVEHSIEILKTDSKEESGTPSPNLVSPRD